jgi:benzoylformate decarboxylase
MYTIQALWTAAHAGIPVVVAVVNNRQYAILKLNLAASGGRSAAQDAFVGMDLDSPPIDYVGLARSMGVEAHLVEKGPDVTEAVAAAFAAECPVLLEVPISPP